MGGAEMVVDEGVSQYGLHRLHIMRQGEPVDIERWIAEKVPEDGEVMTFYRYEERELGIHHLRLYWKEPEQTSVIEMAQLEAADG